MSSSKSRRKDRRDRIKQGRDGIQEHERDRRVNNQLLYAWCDACKVLDKVPAWRWNWSAGKVCPNCQKVRDLAKPLKKGNVRYLGFKTYADYLLSETWRSIRGQVLARGDYRCLMCGKPATQVHHKSYHLDVLTGVDIKPLIPICSGCHHYIEYDKDGRKLTNGEANAKLNRRLYPNSQRRRDRSRQHRTQVSQSATVYGGKRWR